MPEVLICDAYWNEEEIDVYGVDYRPPKWIGRKLREYPHVERDLKDYGQYDRNGSPYQCPRRVFFQSLFVHAQVPHRLCLLGSMPPGYGSCALMLSGLELESRDYFASLSNLDPSVLVTVVAIPFENPRRITTAPAIRAMFPLPLHRSPNHAIHEMPSRLVHY